MFQIALLNPLRFIDTSNINSSFDGDFAISQLLSFQSTKCYFQPWQRSDTLVLQILSDYALSNLSFINIDTMGTALSVPFSPITTTVIGYSFTVYELRVPFTELPEGKYQAVFNYTDESTTHPMVSEKIDLKEFHPNTTLLKYRHSENDFNVIFNTNIEFQFRVESAITNFNPKSNRNVYTDQEVNATQLSSVAFRNFKFYVGFQTGVPPWVLDKVNQIQSVDQVKYDNVFYQVIAGVEFEVITENGVGLLGASIDIQPADNKFNKYVTIDNDTNEILVMDKRIAYYGLNTDLVIAGKFTSYSELEKICINKRTPDPITLIVGTTLGGSEIATFIVDEPENVFTIEWLFAGTATLYIAGLAGQDTDVFIIYKQLDEPTIPLPLTPLNQNEGKGSIKAYLEVSPGDLAIHFNLSTGLGNPNTAYVGWAWMDGRNGTADLSQGVPIGFADGDPIYGIDQLGNQVGSDSITLIKDNLPATPLKFPVRLSSSNQWRASGGSARPVMYAGGIGDGVANDPQDGSTLNMGLGTPVSIKTKGLVALYIQKITD